MILFYNVQFNSWDIYKIDNERRLERPKNGNEERKDQVTMNRHEKAFQYCYLHYRVSTRKRKQKRMKWKRVQGSLCTYFELAHTSHTLSSHRSNHFALASINLSNKLVLHECVCLSICMHDFSLPFQPHSKPRTYLRTHTHTHTHTHSFFQAFLTQTVKRLFLLLI